MSQPRVFFSRLYRRNRLWLPHSAEQRLRLGGVLIDLDVRDSNMKAMFQDLYEIEDIAFLRKTLRRGDVVLDVGANIGYLTAVSASIVGPEGQVHAFEPSPELCARLERLKALNPTLQIVVSNAAAGAKAEWLELSLSGDGNRGWNTLVPGFMPDSQSAGKLRVPVLALDEYVREHALDRVDFVKIDVEGFEFPVLRGMRRTLAKLHPVVLCEVAPGAYPFQDYDIVGLEAFVTGLGYRTFDVQMNPVRISELRRTANVVLLPA